MVGFRSDLCSSSFDWSQCRPLQADNHNRGSRIPPVDAARACYCNDDKDDDDEGAFTSTEKKTVRDVLECPLHAFAEIVGAELTQQQWCKILKAANHSRKLKNKEKETSSNRQDEEEEEEELVREATSKRLKLEEEGTKTHNQTIGDAATQDHPSPCRPYDAFNDEDLMAAFESRGLKLNTESPALISSYHCPGNITSKFVFQERNGFPRHGHHHDEQDNNNNNKLGSRPRFLTNRECARLMGFPDRFIIPDKDSSQGKGLFYHQIGNAVCPPVINSIVAQMLKMLNI
jgi:site-specific DNA-cytosine methylase